MEDIVFRFFLMFSHDTVITPLVVLGYIWWDRKIFFHTIGLILMSMLLNCALKVTFKVPLDPSIGKDWFAFPSGHMQLAVVFYTWLLQSMRHPLIGWACVFICIGIAGGLLYFNYHQPYDIAGAIGIGLLWVWSYKQLLKMPKTRLYLPVILLTSASLLMIYIHWLYGLKDHMWMAYYALIGVHAGEYRFGRNPTTLSIIRKSFATGFFFMSFLILHKIFLGYTFLPSLFQLKWMAIGACIPFSVFLFQPKEPTLPNKPISYH